MIFQSVSQVYHVGTHFAFVFTNENENLDVQLVQFCSARSLASKAVHERQWPGLPGCLCTPREIIALGWARLSSFGQKMAEIGRMWQKDEILQKIENFQLTSYFSGISLPIWLQIGV